MLRRRGVGVDRRTIPVSSPAGAAAAPWSTPTAAAAVAFLDGLGCTGSAATDAAGPEASTPSRGPAASAAPATVAARAAELAAAGMPLLLVGLGDAVVPPCLGGACPDAVVLDLRGVMDPQEGIAASMSGVRVGSVAQPAASEALTRACELTKSADVVGFVPPMGMWDAGQVECAMSTFFGFKASSLIALDALADYVASWTPVVGPGSPNSTEDMEALAEATGGSVLSLAGYRPREIQLAKSMSSNGIPRRVIIVSDDSYLQLTETLASGLKRDGHDTHIANKALRRLAQMEASAAAASAGLPELSQYTAAAGGGDGGALSGAGGGARRRSDGWAGDADPASIDSYVRDAIAWAAGPAAHDGEAVPKPSEEPFVGGADAYATGLPDLDETSAAEPVEEERYGALVVVMTDESLRLHPPSPTMRLVVAARRVNLRIVPLKVRHPLVPPAIVAPLQYLDFSRVLLGRTVTQHQLFRERAKALSDTLRSRRPTAEGQWKLAQQLCQVTQSADDGAGGGAGGAMLSRRAWFHDEVAAWAASPTGAPVRIYDSEPGYGRSSIANDMRDTNPSVIAAHFASSANVQSRDLRLSILRLVFALSARIGDDHSSLLCPGGRARKVTVPGGRVMTLAEFVENAEPEDLAAELIPPLVRRIAEGSAEPSRKSLHRAGTSARLHPVMTPEHGRKSVADSPSERTAHFLRHAQTTMVKSTRHLAANLGVARQLPAHRHAITSSGVHTTAGLGPACTSADAGAGGSVDNDNDDDDDDDDDDEDDDSAASPLDGQAPPLAASGSVGSGPSSADFVDHVAELISRRSGPDFAMAFGLVAVARSGAIPRTITSESELPAQEEALQQALDLQMRDADSLRLRVPTAAALSVAAAAAEPLPANCVLSMALGQTFKANSKKLLRVLCRSFQVVGDRSLLRAWDQQWLQWAAGYSNGRSVDGHQRLARWAIENVERAVNKFNGDWSSGGASPAGAAPGAGAAGSAPSAGPALPSHTANPDVGEALIEALQSEPDCEYGLYHAQHHADICKGELLSRWTRLLSTHPALRFAVEVSRLRRAGHARVHHGPMSRPAAESRLRGPPPGAFLVRYSARANGDVVSFSNRPGSSANAFSHNVVYKLEDGTFATKSRPAATDLVYKDICALLGFYIANRTLSTPVLATQPARDAKP
ncbi:hypothetical protein FNF27_06026 [Cafeteria roenbergensis]|uniref:SH2 domain-containing protein n=1 Tax=Cafeteria roenbergensis TaxID=33653 RepID=A0A5A8E437_CAFRO|nr:hypothetical protein FNF27_06026 [Cafeteria roenbergensis]